MLRPRRRSSRIARIGWFLIAGRLLAATAVQAGPAVYRSLDGPDKTWQLVADGTAAGILSHDHVAAGARNSAGAERIVIAAAAGRTANLSCTVPQMPILDELEARLWVKANRPGVQLALRIVLPRSVGPVSQATATATVRSAPYDRARHWQQLALIDIPKLLANEVRVMRAVPGATIDPREAFVDAVVLMVPGDPQGVEILTDELEVDGVLNPSGAIATEMNAASTTSVTRPSPSGHPAGWRRDALASGGEIGPASPSVRFEGNTLVVDGRAFTPRAIEWRGEPLKFFAECGFNAVRLAGMPSAAQSAEARQHNLWFLCTPPGPDELSRIGFGAASTERILAWFLTNEEAEVDPAYFRRWAEQVRQNDAAVARPIVIAPNSDWAALHRSADILLADHPLSVRISGLEFETWFHQRRKMTPPGTSFWISIPTQLSETASLQAAALSGAPIRTPNIDADQVELLTHIAASSGCRGILFESSSSLAEPNGGARRRAMLLKCINHQLAVWEPWLAGGKILGRLTAAPSSSGKGATSAVVMQVDYARLLMPLRPELTDFEAETGEIASQATSERRVFVIPGIPDSNQVFLLSPTGLRPIEARRVAGGTSIVLEPGDDGCVLLTEDPQVIQTLRQFIARHAAQAARLQRELATMESTTVSATERALAQLGMKHESAAPYLASVTSKLQQAERLIASGHFEPAYGHSASARRVLRLAAQEQRRAVPTPPGLTSEPLAVCYDTLPEHAKFVRSLDTLRGGENLLYGGDFEDIGSLIEFGWQHVNHPHAGITARAELSTSTPRHGKYCLQLIANRRGAPDPALSDERRLPVAAVSTSALFNDPFQTNHPTADTHISDAIASAKEDSQSSAEINFETPVWITSPVIPLDRASMIEITGWLRIPKPLAGNAEGLQIVDSLGGPELAVTVKETAAWQPFRIIRAVPETTEFSFAFLLSGLGSAQIDGVMVRQLAAPTVRRLPPVTVAE